MPIAASEGFAAGDVYALGLLFAGVALFSAVAALSVERRHAFTTAIVYLVLGAALSAGVGLMGIELLDPFTDAHVIERITEIAVIIAVFSAGMKLDRPLRWPEWRATVPLLLVAMPLTIGAITAFASGVMGLSLGAAVLLGAILAPTDPVLAGDVQVGPPGDEDEPEPKFALTAEAGMNDGLAFPFVFLGIFIAGEGGWSWLGEWALADVIYAMGVGAILGAVAGKGVAILVSWMHRRRLLLPALDGWVAMAAVLVIYGVVELAGAYGFLAAFAGGLAFRRHERDHEYHGRVHDGAQTVEQFSELAIILLLGSTVTLSGLAVPGLTGWLLAAVLLFAIRPLSCLVALAPLRLPFAERAFIGWFGIRGIGSFYYLAVALGAGVLAPGEAQVVYWTVVACTGASIILHGFTSTPVVRRLGL